MKAPKLILIGVVLCSFAGSYAFRHWTQKEARAQNGEDARPADARITPSSQHPQRIVSLAPSITEVLYALDLGDQVVGVTRYCDYPREALKKAQIGGYYDPNYEVIVSLKPDLVISLPEHTKVRAHLHELGFKTAIVDHTSVSKIMESITGIGEFGGAQERAVQVLNSLKARMDAVSKRVAGLDRPRVLVSIGRLVKEGKIGKVTVCGPSTIYNDLLQRAGGRNAYEGEVGYAGISGEGIMGMNPDFIVDLVSDMEEKGPSVEGIRKEWAAIPGLKAVENNRVTVLGGDHLTVPGPRVVLLIEELARALHPEGQSRDEL